MHPDTPPTERPTRLRLVDFRVGPGRQLHLGGALAGVLTHTRDRSAAANWIVSTVAGPRPPGADGSIEVDGQVVSVHTLPSPMLAPSAPRVIDGDFLRTQWRTSCARRRDELAASHASHRLDRYRIEAALERARARPVALPRTVEPFASSGPVVEFAAAPAPTEEPVPETEPDSQPSGPEDVEAPERGSGVDTDAPVRAQLQALIGSLDRLPGEPLPEGALLADAWDAHTALARVRDAVDAIPSIDIDGLEKRVNEAREAVAKTSSGISDEARAHIEQCHAVVVEAEEFLLSAKRRQRSRAIAIYEQAVAEELLGLADAGIESYAAFLLAVEHADGPANAVARRVAEAELTEARSALDEELQVPDMPTRAELEEREAQMRVRATQLLGQPPGLDPAAELRSLRVPTEERTAVLDEIAGVLEVNGVEVTGDLLAFARAFVAPPASKPDASVGVPAESAGRQSASSPAAPRPPTVNPDRAVDVESLEQQRFAHDRALEQLDTDLAAIDAVYNAPLSGLGARDLSRAVEVLLDLYRAGRLMAGRLPLVLDGALDGLGASAREAAVNVLVEADDLQTIVVSEDVEVMQSLAQAGGTLVRWPESDSGTDDATPFQPTTTLGS